MQVLSGALWPNDLCIDQNPSLQERLCDKSKDPLVLPVTQSSLQERLCDKSKRLWFYFSCSLPSKKDSESLTERPIKRLLLAEGLGHCKIV